MRWIKNLFADTGETGVSTLLRRFKQRQREKRVDSAIEAKRIAEVRADAGVDQVEARVDTVEREVTEQVRPALDALEESRQREASLRREAERAQLGHEPH